MLQSRLFSYVMAGSVSEGDWVHSATQAKRPFYVVYFSRLYFLNRSRKIPLGVNLPLVKS